MYKEVQQTSGVCFFRHGGVFGLSGFDKQPIEDLNEDATGAASFSGAPQGAHTRLTNARRRRCEALGIDLSSVPETIHRVCAHSSPLVSVVCSRVGHDAKRHRTMSQQIAASMQQIKRDDATLLVFRGTAIAPWAIHAAGVFSVSMLVLDETEDRDRLMIALADRVDGVYVRPKGKITGLLKRRAEINSGIVRVAIDIGDHHRSLEWDLLGAGAVGRYLPTDHHTGDEVPIELQDLMEIPGARAQPSNHNEVDWSQYLVHSTRAMSGPWPGQTWDQYRDDLLLADPQSASRDAIDSLCRIVRQQRIIAGAVTSRRSTPVVCLSEVPLPELIGRRTYRSHLHRWDYEPFGIAIRRDAALALGIEPVIYGEPGRERELAAGEKYRFQATGKTHDWTAEREWRSGRDIDLSAVDAKDIRIFVPDAPSAMRVLQANRVGWPVSIVNADSIDR
ncbi:hypothetical protein [Rhodopirellula sallentina]|uniref:Uncharacterized protein n=1 Tax=Rhodopirellula sallentina SM41 TaxID=1263870 RepID=M5U9D3_9BACT|nr:hypothetical protein [Rhodopirellula sallentina]EMI54466.1 hypothetical protein RSSM_04061 [Rhodopirellula sallentina SM41]